VSQPRLGVEPTPLPPTDLATVFGRSSALRGRLEPLRDATLPPAGQTDDPAPATENTKAEKRTRSRSQADPRPAAHPPARGVIAYLPISLRDRLRQRRRSDEAPFADIVLDAVEATADQLDELLAAGRPHTERSTLFVRNTRPEPDLEPHVQVYLRLNAENLRVLDRLTEQHNAPSRSALIAAALRRYLEA